MRGRTEEDRRRLEEERRREESGATRETMLERAERAERRMNEYLKNEINQALSSPPPGVTPAAALKQRSLVFNAASAFVRRIQEMQVEGKLDKFEAFDLLNNAKYEWNIPVYREAIHAEAARMVEAFGDAIPCGRKADQLVTLRTAWECCHKLAQP
jgi:hypothetical protein